MNIPEYIDHTYLKAVGTTAEIDQLLLEAKTHHFKSVCVNPTWVKHCKQVLENTGVLVCTVIGFPLGANTKETKVFETLNAVENGADEIDMVVNVGDVLMGQYAKVASEVKAIVKAAQGRLVKVIFETCYLTKAHIALLSEALVDSGATFLKTSTGFGTGGATVEDVSLMKQKGAPLQVKASGGVRTKEDFDKMVEAGATRIGTSNGVAILSGSVGKGY
jgi:deoxyribose-phosphate aldolase